MVKGSSDAQWHWSRLWNEVWVIFLTIRACISTDYWDTPIWHSIYIYICIFIICPSGSLMIHSDYLSVSKLLACISRYWISHACIGFVMNSSIVNNLVVTGLLWILFDFICLLEIKGSCQARLLAIYMKVNTFTHHLCWLDCRSTCHYSAFGCTCSYQHVHLIFF